MNRDIYPLIAFLLETVSLTLTCHQCKRRFKGVEWTEAQMMNSSTNNAKTSAMEFGSFISSNSQGAKSESFCCFWVNLHWNFLHSVPFWTQSQKKPTPENKPEWCPTHCRNDHFCAQASETFLLVDRDKNTTSRGVLCHHWHRISSDAQRDMLQQHPVGHAAPSGTDNNINQLCKNVFLRDLRCNKNDWKQMMLQSTCNDVCCCQSSQTKLTNDVSSPSNRQTTRG